MKEEFILKLLDRLLDDETVKDNSSINDIYIGKYVIIRTYSAGVWFGKLSQKAGNEVILNDARRMWRWRTKKSISLSSCALHGIDENDSKICESIDAVWLEAIEILPCSVSAKESIKGSKIVEAE